MQRFVVVAILSFFLLPSAAQQPAATQTQPSPRHPSPTQPAAPDRIWADLMKGNQRFVAGKPKARHLVGLQKQFGQKPATRT
jgi:hypothetical protein